MPYGQLLLELLNKPHINKQTEYMSKYIYEYFICYQSVCLEDGAADFVDHNTVTSHTSHDNSDCQKTCHTSCMK